MWTLNPKRPPRRSKRDPNNHLKRPRSESDTRMAMKEKEKVIESSHRPDVDIDVDIPAEERRMLKIGMMASRLEIDPPLSTLTR
ncbi:hypothetical protein R1flu_003838 [Riccia fluitans]|uniref:Uncharacterized protein n=1 Tax=Riccia fluitans TaxID=41844 RepID=A0ABD1YA56_9MARC